MFFFFKQKTAYEMRISDWSSDVCSSDLGLDGLIRELAREDGLERIRYTTSHPNDMTDGLIAAHGEIGKLMPFFHLPVQAGSDRILAAMNRSHSVDSYPPVLERVREARPAPTISGHSTSGLPRAPAQD